jgi:sRNA-binding carbon storage regulator CsrA
MRRKDESIFIYPKDIPENMTVEELFAGGSTEIVVTETNHAQSKLGIKAPKELVTVRGELESNH